MPLTRHTVARLGTRTYEGWSEAKPAGAHASRWKMTPYRVLDGDELIDEQRWSSEFQTVSLDDVISEAAAVGLNAEPADQGLVLLRRRAR